VQHQEHLLHQVVDVMVAGSEALQMSSHGSRVCLVQLCQHAAARFR
jgi:hypothetical protein